MAPRVSANNRKNPNVFIEWHTLSPRWTGPQTEWQIWCSLLVTKMRRDKRTNWFFEPVDAVKTVGYLKIITTPMDIQTIMKKLCYKQYLTAQEVKTDFMLIVENCLKFYKEGSTEYMKGLDLKAYVDEHWVDCPPVDDCPETVPEKVVDTCDSIPTENSKNSKENEYVSEAKKHAQKTSLSDSASSNVISSIPEKNHVPVQRISKFDQTAMLKLAEEVGNLPHRFIVPFLRIIQIRNVEQGNGRKSLRVMCEKAIDLDDLCVDIVSELQDYMEMVRNDSPKLEQYLQEIENRRKSMRLEVFRYASENVRKRQSASMKAQKSDPTGETLNSKKVTKRAKVEHQVPCKLPEKSIKRQKNSDDSKINPELNETAEEITTVYRKRNISESSVASDSDCYLDKSDYSKQNGVNSPNLLNSSQKRKSDNGRENDLTHDTPQKKAKTDRIPMMDIRNRHVKVKTDRPQKPLELGADCKFFEIDEEPFQF